MTRWTENVAKWNREGLRCWFLGQASIWGNEAKTQGIVPMDDTTLAARDASGKGKSFRILRSTGPRGTVWKLSLHGVNRRFIIVPWFRLFVPTYSLMKD